MQAIVATMAAQTVLAAVGAAHISPVTVPPPSSARIFPLVHLFDQPLGFSLFQSSASGGAPKPLVVVATTKNAVAVLKGESQVQGVVNLLQENGGATILKVRVTGLAPGPHGFHLHEYGDTTKGCISTGAHFNPNNLTHGGPEDSIRHAGDLGNIFANSDGVAEATIVDTQIPLSGPTAIIGRSFVVHELEDDLGKGGKELSLSTGNAGGRLACGVVGLTDL
ncbi:hypothetical protein HPP92_025128 [Vanilla planifolia]|uniref:Superoxide dismutase [Cu-Zn] n=1 Tax=Vanilla planifolia TaxID=51239 RepID=A0A835PLA9_VANPL|nr:hypothetical protein HPP92_025128 [Vanilla planifolia]